MGYSYINGDAQSEADKPPEDTTMSTQATETSATAYNCPCQPLGSMISGEVVKDIIAKGCVITSYSIHYTKLYEIPNHFQ